MILAVSAVLYFGGLVFFAFLALISVFSVYETAHITPGQGFRPHTFPAYLCAACYPFVGYFLGEDKMLSFFFFMLVVAMAGLVIRRPKEPENAIVSLLFFCYPLALLLHLTRIFLISSKPLAYSLLIITIAAPSLTDIFALLGGTKFGKHKLCPTISPAKTKEGAASGLIGGPVAAAIVYFGQCLWKGNTSFVALLIIGILCSVLGQFGDLFASLLKRWAGIKDYSNLFPGHGGVMDRLDSIMICAPMVYMIYQFVWM